MNIGKWTIRKKDLLDMEIETVEELLVDETDVESDSYKTLLGRLQSLYDLRNAKRRSRDREPISPNTILVVAGGIAEILLIMNYENLHVISTKAWSRILRGKV